MGSQRVNTLNGERVTTIAVCTLIMNDPPMEVHTIVKGLPDGVVKLEMLSLEDLWFRMLWLGHTLVHMQTLLKMHDVFFMQSMKLPSF